MSNRPRLMAERGADRLGAENTAPDPVVIHAAEQVVCLVPAPQPDERLGAVLPGPVEADADQSLPLSHAVKYDTGRLLEPTGGHEHMCEIGVRPVQMVGVADLLGDGTGLAEQRDPGVEFAVLFGNADSERVEGMAFLGPRTCRPGDRDRIVAAGGRVFEAGHEHVGPCLFRGCGGQLDRRRIPGQ